MQPTTIAGTADRHSALPQTQNTDRLGQFGAISQVLASLIWIGQAALLSYSVGVIAAGGAVQPIIWCAVGVLVLGILRSILDASGARMTFRCARSVLTSSRQLALAALAGTSPLDTSRASSGVAASTLAEQSEALVPYLSRFRSVRLRVTIVPLVILCVVFVWSWVAALVLFIAAPLIPVFMALIGWRAKAASEAHLVELGSMNAFLLDRLRGLATIRTLGAVDLTAKRLRQDAESLRKRTMAVLRIAFLSSAVLELFAALGVAMVAVYVGFHLLGQLPFGAWGQKLSLSEGLFILLLAPAFFEPLRELSTVWHDRASGEAAVAALDNLSKKGKSLPGADTSDDKSVRAAVSVRIKGLSFRHAGQEATVLDGFDLDVAPGEHVAVVAPSGAGKSTLIALIAGLALPDAGEICIDGERLTTSSASRLRRHMGWIGQHPHILAGTMQSNVRLGRPNIAQLEITEALRLAGLADAAAKRDSAPIGENGLGLSGGEASRLALARIAARNNTGLILADEPTAHLDSQTASNITDSLLALADGRTLIVATHDPALAARMDRIVRLTGAA
ncbi:MAG: thiol reductant ABC exporter subunit CydD [Rhizobiaceae bacterium]|nr:thiol reductant ABC exporter subunit CydD [Rhizobiaceae bacterium]